MGFYFLYGPMLRMVKFFKKLGYGTLLTVLFPLAMFGILILLIWSLVKKVKEKTKASIKFRIFIFVLYCSFFIGLFFFMGLYIYG